jgi:hypothetical protein
MCVFEFCSTALTTFRAIQAVKAGGSLQSQRHTIIVVMLEQGKCKFFIASLSANIFLGILYFGFVSFEYEHVL